MIDVFRPDTGVKELSSAKRRLLEQRMAGISYGAKDFIRPRSVDARTPASVEQHRVWLHTTLEPELPIYNEAITIHRQGSLDLTLLERSFNDVLRRHEAWRTSFAMQTGELMQVIHPVLLISLSLVDLSALPENHREIEACRLATEDAMQTIDLQCAPLFRARVFRITPEDHWLQLTLHHIIFDGVSIHRTFLPELAATYAAFATGNESPFPIPALQYADYAIWREEQLAAPAMAWHLDYWRRELAGELPILKLPTNRSRPALLSHRGAMECFTFSAELSASLRALSRTHGATIYMILLAALKTLFFRYSSQEDVIVGGLADGRRKPELEQMMGYFLDTFAIRTRPSSDLPFSTYLDQVRHAVLGALAAAEVPFSHVVQAIQSYRDHSHHPIFQTFLAVQPQSETFVEGWELRKTNVSLGVAKFDLYIEVDQQREQTDVRFMYSTDLFNADTIQRMGAHWIALLTAITRTPDCSLGTLPLLTLPERDLMLVEWNQHQRPVSEMALHDLVKAQAARTPDNCAAVFEDHSLTYAELDQQAEHLAGHLRKAGAGPGQLVAVCLERSLTPSFYAACDPEDRSCLSSSRPRHTACPQVALPRRCCASRHPHSKIIREGCALHRRDNPYLGRCSHHRLTLPSRC